MALYISIGVVGNMSLEEWSDRREDFKLYYYYYYFFCNPNYAAFYNTHIYIYTVVKSYNSVEHPPTLKFTLDLSIYIYRPFLSIYIYSFG